MARKETTAAQGHTHMYTEQVTDPNRASYTTKTNGHRHRVVRDGTGRVTRMEREASATGVQHTHRVY